MERETGIEPATSSLGSWRSTAELLPLAGSEHTHFTRHRKVIQIIIPGGLICKECSVPDIAPQPETRGSCASDGLMVRRVDGSTVCL
jgi:hypothetical protein